MTDFTAHKHPVLAVACPHCRAPAGSWCKRPSEHQAMDLHAARKKLADDKFVEIYGEDAWIKAAGDGFVIGGTTEPRSDP